MNYCPECKDVLPPGASKCQCGWEREELGAVYPTLNGLKDAVAERLRLVPPDRWPIQIPRDAMRGAEWFVRLIGRPERTEAPQVVDTKKGRSWSWPYQQRVLFLLTLFLEASDDMRALIVSAREDEIYWRGDDKDSFVRIIHATLEMRDMGVDEYRKRHAGGLYGQRDRVFHIEQESAQDERHAPGFHGEDPAG